MRDPQTGLSAKKKLCAIILTVLLLSISAAQEAKTERATIEKVIHASISWAKNKDFKLLYSVIANDCFAILARRIEYQPAAPDQFCERFSASTRRACERLQQDFDRDPPR